MNTRISITPNGPLHLGHIYLALLNEQLAHNSGGKFHLRFDDVQPYWTAKVGVDGQRTWMRGAVEDLTWLGIPVDSIVSEHDQDWRVHSRVLPLLAISGHEFRQLDGDMERDYLQAIYKHTSQPGRQFYPFVPWLTVPKAIWDHYQEITHVIRGDELITEASFYAYVFVYWGWPVPEQIFIPRLTTSEGGDLADVSKTRGNYKVGTVRAQGWSPSDVRRVLADSCLVEPVSGWTIENLKSDPTLTIRKPQPKEIF